MEWLQWLLVLVFTLVFFWFSPKVKTSKAFFKGFDKIKPNVFILTSSLVISWIFAKSITNAANLGQSFGLVGGFAYGAYYLSFFVAGVVIYQLREKFSSIHDFLQTRFGRSALISFSVVISIRLFNEVWSNTSVIGQYFGPVGSSSYILAVVLFGFLTLAYSLRGGLRASLLTDALQFLLFGVLLFVVLAVIIPAYGVEAYVQSGTWSFATGVNLLIVALIQIFSYPFHDPVMTDRGFISSRKTTLISFVWAGILGFIFIVLFSSIGIYASFIGVQGDATVGVAESLGLVLMLVINLIMITSAASTLDSTFASSSKLAVIDLGLGRKDPVWTGRLVMLAVAVIGALPLVFSPTILSATTVSGTMVLGLAPIFLLHKLKAPPLSFHLSLWIGVAAGIILLIGVPEVFWFTTGPYADLLTVNIIGTILCFIGFFVTGGTMAILIFGGAYSNLPALQAVLEYARQHKIDRIISAGDCIAYAGMHAQTVELMQTIECVQGNTDYAVGNNQIGCHCGYKPGLCSNNAYVWMSVALEQVSDEQKLWLKQLPRHIEFISGGKKCIVVHGAFSDQIQDTPTYVWESLPWDVKQKEFTTSGADVIFAGHTSLPYIQEQDGKMWCNVGGCFGPQVDAVVVEDGQIEAIKIDYDVEQTLEFMKSHEKQHNEIANVEADFSSYREAFRTGIWNAEMMDSVGMPQAERKMGR